MHRSFDNYLLIYPVTHCCRHLQSNPAVPNVICFCSTDNCNTDHTIGKQVINGPITTTTTSTTTTTPGNPAKISKILESRNLWKCIRVKFLYVITCSWYFIYILHIDCITKLDPNNLWNWPTWEMFMSWSCC